MWNPDALLDCSSDCISFMTIILRVFVNRPVTITGRSDDHYITTLTLATRRVTSARSARRVSSPSGQEHISSVRSNTQRRPLSDTNQDPFVPQRPTTPPNAGGQGFRFDSSLTPEQRVRRMFPGLGEVFDPIRDIPGQDIVQIGRASCRERV